MIIIKNGGKINPLSQKSYSDAVNSIDYSSIPCTNCHNSEARFQAHSYYTRNVSFLGFKTKIKILRVICTVCRKTHAILVESIVPYFIISKEDIVTIIGNNDHHDFSYIYFLKRFFKAITDYERICLIKSRNWPCIFITT